MATPVASQTPSIKFRLVSKGAPSAQSRDSKLEIAIDDVEYNFASLMDGLWAFLVNDGQIRNIPSSKGMKPAELRDYLMRSRDSILDTDRMLLIMSKGQAFDSTQASKDAAQELSERFDLMRFGLAKQGSSYIAVYDLSRGQLLDEKMDISNEVKIEKSYPLEGDIPPLVVNRGTGSTYVDCVCYRRMSGMNVMYLFSGDKWATYRYDGNRAVSISFPATLKEFPNLTDEGILKGGIDAVTFYSGSFYFFQGGRYVVVPGTESIAPVANPGKTNVSPNRVEQVAPLFAAGSIFRRGLFDAVMAVDSPAATMTGGLQDLMIFKRNRCIMIRDFDVKGKRPTILQERRWIAGTAGAVIFRADTIQSGSIFKGGYVESGAYMGENRILLIKEDRAMLVEIVRPSGSSTKYELYVRSEQAITDILPNIYQPFVSSKIYDCEESLVRMKSLSEQWMEEYNTKCNRKSRQEYDTMMMTSEEKLRFANARLLEKQIMMEEMKRDRKKQELAREEIRKTLSDIEDKIKEIEMIPIDKRCPGDKSFKTCDSGMNNRCDGRNVMDVLLSPENYNRLSVSQRRDLNEYRDPRGMLRMFDIREHPEYYKYIRADEVKNCNPRTQTVAAGAGYRLEDHPIIKRDYVRLDKVRAPLTPEMVRKIPGWETKYIQKGNIPAQKRAGDFNPKDHPEYAKFIETLKDPTLKELLNQ